MPPSYLRERAAAWQLINRSGIVMVFLVLFATLSLTVPDFLTPRNIQGLLLSVTLIGSIAVTMMFVLALGEVDLSVASIVAFSGVVASTLITATHSVVLGVAGGVLAGGRSARQRRADRALADQLADRHARDDGSRARAFITSNGDAVMISEERFFDLGGGSFLGIVSDLEQHRRLRRVRLPAAQDGVRQERARGGRQRRAALLAGCR